MTMPTGNQGQVSVAVVPDTTGFAQQLQADLTAALAGLEQRVRAALRPVEEAFEDAARAAGRSLENAVQQATTALTALRPAATRAATALRNVDRQATAATGSLTSMTLAAWSANNALSRVGGQNVLGTADLERRLEEIAEAVRNAARDITTTLQPALAGLQASMDRAADNIARDADRAGDAIGGEIARGVAVANAALALLADGRDRLGVLGAAAARASAGVLTLTTSLAASLGGALLRVGASLASTAGLITALSLAAASAVQGIAALVAALAPLPSILLTLPAVIGSVAAITQTLKVAFDGLGDTIKAGLSGDLEAYMEAYRELTPAAQELAGHIVSLADRFDRLKESIQENFFAGMAVPFADLADQLLNIGQRLLPELATALGDVADHMIRVASSGAFTGGLIETLKATTRGVAGLKDEAGLATDAFGHLLLVGSQYVDRMYDAIGRLITRWSEWVINASNTGELEARIDRAIETFKQLGRIAGNVGDIFGAMFDAAADNGNSLLTTLETVTRWLADFAASSIGQEAFGAVFQAASDITRILLIPSLQAFLPILAEVIEQISVHLSQALIIIEPYLQSFFETIGLARGDFIALVDQGLSALVGGLEILLPIVQGLLPIFQNLAYAVGGTLRQFFQDMVPVVQNLWAALEPLIPQLADLASVIVSELAYALTGIITALAPVLPILIELGIQIAQTLAPVIADLAVILAQGLADAIRTVTPTLSKLVDAVAKAAPSFIRLVELGVDLLVGALEQLMPVVETLAPIFLDLALTAGAALLEILIALVPMFTEIWRAVEPLLPQLTQLAKDILIALVDAGLAFVAAITPLLPLLVQLGVELAMAILPAFAGFLEAITPLLPELSVLAQELMVALLAVVQSLAPLLPALVDAFVQMLPSLLELIPAITDLVIVLTPLLVLVTDLAVWIGQHLMQAWALVYGQWVSAAAWILEHLLPAIHLFVVGMEGIGEAFRVTGEELKKFWDDTVDRFQRGLDRWREIWDDFKNKVSEVWGEIKQFFSDSIGEITDGLSRAGQAFSEAAVKAFKEIFLALKLVFWDAPNWLFNAGLDVIQGFFNGMIEKAKNIGGWVNDNIVNPIKKAIGGLPGFDFGSPSKVTAQYGRWITEGLAIGMEDAEQQVVAAAEAITRAAALPGMSTTPGAPMLPGSLGPQAFTPALTAPGTTATAGAAGGPLVVNVYFDGVAPTAENAQLIASVTGSAVQQAIAERDARMAVKGLT